MAHIVEGGVIPRRSGCIGTSHLHVVAHADDGNLVALLPAHLERLHVVGDTAYGLLFILLLYGKEAGCNLLTRRSELFLIDGRVAAGGKCADDERQERDM